ncbi:hypothetical protein [Oceanospirillum sediminis]|uniref:Uncharacterized protein n=1 Tax=Oceanospirillum sediminis TaxID=2760088 RepID=A0A839IIM2_9GAMM|nr:hypothetical protein [Oceanospirillum sediminis]MBB1485183.1 hypothetical protein [Oceanospirillum sediminis]
MSSDDSRTSFCLLKSEAYLFNKKAYIESRLLQEGLQVTEIWQVKLTLRDFFQIYDSWAARFFSVLRTPPLFTLDLFIVEGDDAIARMHTLKYQIRQEIAFGLKKGGFLHAPDSVAEARQHRAILLQRVVSKTTISEPVDG